MGLCKRTYEARYLVFGGTLFLTWDSKLCPSDLFIPANVNVHATTNCRSHNTKRSRASTQKHFCDCCTSRGRAQTDEAVLPVTEELKMALPTGRKEVELVPFLLPEIHPPQNSGSATDTSERESQARSSNPILSTTRCFSLKILLCTTVSFSF